jgi:predicted nucleic acid-binding protein
LAKDIMLRLHPQVPLRTLDAIHLATCISIVAGPLFTTDKRMIEAATALKIPFLN